MPEYGSDSYWDQRYQTAETVHFEWYASFLELEDKITAVCTNEQARILIIGCGTSRFSEQMYDAGYHDITSVDISQICINKMGTKYSKDKPDLKCSDGCT